MVYLYAAFRLMLSVLTMSGGTYPAKLPRLIAEMLISP